MADMAYMTTMAIPTDKTPRNNTKKLTPQQQQHGIKFMTVYW
jgi:hypothetical protein